MNLQIGDTIQCASDEDMIRTSEELAKCGYFTDWLNIKEEPPRRYILTVLGKDKG